MSDSKPTVGSMRFIADKRQIGGVLMVSGFAAMIQPMFGIAASIGSQGTSVNSGVGLAALVGDFFIFVTGLLSIFLGYMETVHDFGVLQLTGTAIIITQFTWISYISNMVGVGKTIHGDGFIPMDYMPTLADNRFVGAMGILAILAYGFGLVGGVAFSQFNLFTYQKGRPEERHAGYFKQRLGAYAFMFFVGGLSQLLLGAYILARFGNSLPAPIGVAFYLVNIPAVSIAAGAVQALLGLWGYVRAFDHLVFGPGDNSYQVAIGFGWLVQLALQVLTQSSYLPGADGAMLAQIVAAFSFVPALMPAYLDFKARSVPATIVASYYGLVADADTEGAKDLEQGGMQAEE